jgi:molybdopterin synthase catalytic subunit
MYVLGVAGPAPERGTAVERLVAAATDRGRVGVVAAETGGATEDPYRESGAAETHRLGSDGWAATGEARSLDDVLDALAPTCDYAVVAGRPDAAIPHVALGNADPTGAVLDRADGAAGVDPEAALDAVEKAEPRETLHSLVREAKAAEGSAFAGAVATFTGRVRPRDGPDDDYTERLEFEKYDGVAAERMAAIREDIEARDGVHRVVLHHRTGVVEAEEDIVHVVVLAGHRGEAFAAVEDGIDRLKEEVPLFKKEVTVEDEFWAHDRP